MFFFGKNKKEELEDGDDLEVDEFDFDDLDDFDDFDTEPREPTTREMAWQVGKTAASELADGVYKQTAKDIIPGDFDSNIKEVKDFASHTKDLLEKSKEEITGSLSKVLPKAIAEKLGIARDSAEAKRATEAEAREAGIKNSLDSIFNKQANIEKKLDESKEVQREVAIESSKMAISKVQTDVMGGMSNDISRLTGFFLNIGSEYFKKSLELQYKSYYVQLDILKASSTYFKGFSTQLDSIVKNTGLPEHVKVTQADRLGDKLKEDFANKVYQYGYSNNAFIQNIKNNIERKIKGYTTNIKDFISQIGGIFEMSEAAGGIREMASRAAGTWLGKKITGKLMKFLSPKMKEKFEDNETLKAIGHALDNITNNTSTAAEAAKKKAREQGRAAEETEGFKGFLSRGVWNIANNLLGLTNYRAKDMRLETRSMEDVTESAIFDNNFYFKVVDAIPMYLSRILKQNTDLVSMYQHVNHNALLTFSDFAPLYVYNYLGRKLDTVGNYRKAVSKSLGRKDPNAGYKSMASSTVERAIDELKEDKKANKKEIKTLLKPSNKKALEAYITAVSKDKKVQGDSDIMFTKAFDDDAPEVIRRYINNNPEVKKLIEAMQKATESGGTLFKERTKREYEYAKDDIDNDFPVGTIKKLFEETSILAENDDVKNQLNNKEAGGIAYAFAYYIKHENRDVIPDMDVLKAVFKRIPADDTPKSVIAKVNLFLDDVETILSSTKSKYLELLKLFGVVNIAIKNVTHSSGEGIDKTLETFMKVDRADPNLFGEKNRTITIENLFRKKIGDGSTVTEFLDEDDIEDMFKGREIKEIRDIIASNKFIEGFSNITDEAIKRFKEGDTWSEKFSNLAEYTKEEARKVLTAARDKLDNSLDQLSKEFNELKEKGVTYISEKVMKYLKKLEDEIEDVIKKEKDTFEETRSTLQQAINNIDANATDPGDIEELQEEIEELKEKHDKRLEGYRVLRELLTDMRKELLDLIESADKNSEGSIKKAAEQGKKLYDILMKKVESFKVLLKKFKEEDI